MEQRTCVTCGSDYSPTGTRQRHCMKCSPETARGPRIRNLTCKRCAVDFTHPTRRDNCLACSPFVRGVEKPPPECAVPWASCRYCHEVFIARNGRKHHAGRCSHKLRYVPREMRTCVSGCGATTTERTGKGPWSCRGCKAVAERRRNDYKRQTGNHRKRARYHGVSYVPIRSRDIFDRDGWRCYLCGDNVVSCAEHHVRKATMDHVVPMSKGGDHQPENVRTACWECNTLKGEMSQEAYLATHLNRMFDPARMAATPK